MSAPTDIYSITVPVFERHLKNLSAWLTKAEKWCDENGKPHSHILEARLAPDMNPFSFQIRSATNFTVTGISSKNFEWQNNTVPLPGEDSFEGLQALVSNSLAKLEKVKPEDIIDQPFDIWPAEAVENGAPARRLTSDIGQGKGRNFKWDNTMNFLRQMVIPNFWFHISIAYGLMRMQGVPLGKFDFLAGGAPLSP